MTKIITVAQQKGGSGKTTIAAHLAISLMKKNSRVHLIDIDPQGSLTRWYNMRSSDSDNLALTQINGWRLESAINKIRDADYIIIDAPPHTDTETKTAIRVADIVVVPMQPSPTDLWATADTINFARSEDVPAKILLNRFTQNSKTATKVLQNLYAEYGKEIVLTNSFGNRVAFSDCFLDGKTVLEVTANKQAKLEVEKLTQEILEIINFESLVTS